MISSLSTRINPLQLTAISDIKVVAEVRVPLAGCGGDGKIHRHRPKSKTGTEIHHGTQDGGMGAGGTKMELKIHRIDDPILIPV